MSTLFNFLNKFVFATGKPAETVCLRKILNSSFMRYSEQACLFHTKQISNLKSQKDNELNIVYPLSFNQYLNSS